MADYDGIEIVDEQLMHTGIADQIFYPKNNFIQEYF